MDAQPARQRVLARLSRNVSTPSTGARPTRAWLARPRCKGAEYSTRHVIVLCVGTLGRVPRKSPVRRTWVGCVEGHTNIQLTRHLPYVQQGNIDPARPPCHLSLAAWGRVVWEMGTSLALSTYLCYIRLGPPTWYLPTNTSIPHTLPPMVKRISTYRKYGVIGGRATKQVLIACKSYSTC